MVFVMKILRKFPFIKSCNHSTLRCLSRRIEISRQYHLSSSLYVKMFTENENKYAYNIMQSNGYVIDFLTNSHDQQPLKQDELSKVSDTKWLQENSRSIFNFFSALGVYCSHNNIHISSNQFDDFIDTLTDNIKFATDEELKLLFYGLTFWPEPESIRTRNYIEVWAALDDECVKRINKWSYDQMLLFVSLFYMLNVTKYSDFSYKCLQKLTSKAKQLSKNQIVKTLFFIGITRKSPIEVHNLEIKIEQLFYEFSIDELAIIAMGLFKSKTPIRSTSLVTKIIDKIILQSNEIHEVSLAALLKIIRYSMKTRDDTKVYELLTSLQHVVPRLSIMCNVHVALVGTGTLTFHESCLNVIADTLTPILSQARLKDLERLVLTYGTFNFLPKNNDFFVNLIEELRKSQRAKEIEKYGRVFSCSIAYLGLLEIYPADLMNKVLSPDFLKHAYGKHCQQYGREILTINNVSKIFNNDSNVNFLSDRQAILLAQKYTEYMPDDNYPKQYNALEKMFLDITKVLQNSRGGKEYVTGFHILSHHQRGDIIICNDHQGCAVPVHQAFSESRFGLLSKPKDSNLWIALIVANRNAILSTGVPSGHYLSKVRELNALGFYAAIVNGNNYCKLESSKEKITYLDTLVKEAIQNKKIFQ